MNQEKHTLQNGDCLTVYSRKNKSGDIKWRWKLQSHGNNETIGNSQPSGFHNRIDCLMNFERISNGGFKVDDLK